MPGNSGGLVRLEAQTGPGWEPAFQLRPRPVALFRSLAMRWFEPAISVWLIAAAVVGGRAAEPARVVIVTPHNDAIRQ